MNVGDVCVWSIVSTEQAVYTFYVPPTLAEIKDPIAPFPVATKYLTQQAPPDLQDKRTLQTFTANTDLPLMSLYGRGFNKMNNGSGPKYLVYYGDRPARYNEARCEEVMAAAEPGPDIPRPAPIFLVRKDGMCILPTGLYYR